MAHHQFAHAGVGGQGLASLTADVVHCVGASNSRRPCSAGVGVGGNYRRPRMGNGPVVALENKLRVEIGRTLVVGIHHRQKTLGVLGMGYGGCGKLQRSGKLMQVRR